MEWLVVAVAKSAVLLFVVVTVFAYTTLLERKLIGRFQVRLGPNRVGPFGLLQPAADGIKLLFKEDLAPAGADRVVFTLAPLIALVSALVAFAVIPFGGTVTLFGVTTELVIADVNIGALYLLAVGSMSVYGIMLAGWASNNKYSLLGGVRSTAQVISYEIALGLALVGLFMIAGTLRLPAIVAAQEATWFIFLQPLGFLVFLIAGTAEVNRAPFDFPEAEQELTGGFHTEYSGMKFAMFQMAEYLHLITISAIAATLYLGGYQGPFGFAPGPHWLALKVLFFLCCFIWIRATLPRFRYDQLMQIGWKALLPLALVNIFVTGIVIILLQGG